MQINKKLDLEINKKITISRSDLRILSKTSYAHMYSIYLDLKLFHLYQEQKTWRCDYANMALQSYVSQAELY